MSTPELSWGVCDEAIPTTISAIPVTLGSGHRAVNTSFARQNDFVRVALNVVLGHSEPFGMPAEI